MTFLTSFKAVHYRGIDGLSFPRLANANLVTGVNGIGKTAVIEAMWLFAERYNTLFLWNPDLQRSDNPILDPIAKLANGVLELEGMENESLHSLKATFKKVGGVSDASLPIPISTENSFVGSPTIGQIDTELDGIPAGQKNTGMFSTPWGTVAFHTHEPVSERPTNAALTAKFQHETPEVLFYIYSDMVRKNHKDDFRNAVNLIFPKVVDVGILTDKTGEPYLSAVTDDGVQLPLHDLGGGVVRLCRLFLGFFVARGGVLFVDEMENGLHHSVLKDVWARGRAWMRQWNVQLVVTTHSAECIDAALAAFEDAPDDLAIHRLSRNEKTGKVEATTFTGETLEGVRDLDLETR